MLTTATPLVLRAAFALVALTVLNARAATSASSEWIIESWYVADGLPNNNIAAIAQAEDGHLWLAMPDSIARFDGVRFERFAPEEIGIDSRHRIRALSRGRDNALWVAADHDGAIRLQDGATQTFAKAMNLPVDCLVEDATGAMWITYFGGEIRRVKDGSVKRWTEADGLPPRARGTLATDSRGRLWFAKDANVGIFRNERFESLVRVTGAAPRVAAASSGGVWISANSQLWKFDEGGSLKDCGRFQPAGVRGETTALLEDRTGALWIGTSSIGLLRYDGVKFQNVPVSDREISALTEDQEGNLWVGTIGGGLNRITPRAIRLEAPGDGNVGENLQSVCQDTEGVFWAATSNGLLAQREPDGWKITTLDEAHAVRGATCVAADTTGGVWIGTAVGELHYRNQNRLQTFRAADGLSARTVRSLFASSNGDLWLASEGPTTLQVYRGGKFVSLSVPAGAAHLRTIVEDMRGTIWVGAQKGMLLRVEGNQLVDASEPLGGISSSIRALHVTSDNSLWLGFGGHGVGRLRAGKFGLILPKHGLYHNNLSQIVSDDRGSIWFGCDRGLFKVRKDELDAVAEGRAASLQSVVYGRSQGLPSLQAQYGFWPGAFRSREGRIVIPMRSGLAIADPGRLRIASQPPSVLLKRVAVDEEAVAFYGGPLPLGPEKKGKLVALHKSPSKLALDPGHRQVLFDFTAVALGAPENVQFRYRLDGFDRDWISTDERSAKYPRLEAGNYRFRVIARNNEGIWNETGAALAFSVTPFVWQRWWFRIAAVGLFSVAVGAAVRYVSFRRLSRKLETLERQAALEKERARIARDIHDDVGNRLTEISLLSELALRDGEHQKNGQYVQQISSTVRHVTDSLDEIIWAVSPRNDTLPSVIHYIGEFAIEFLHTAQISCRMELPDQIPNRHVSAEIRHNLFLAVKESLHNVVRHAGASEVVLRVVMDEKCLSIIVHDNGRGFASSTVNDPGADGLRNMKQRMEEIQGSFALRSEPGSGKGTEITFSYPWRGQNGKY